MKTLTFNPFNIKGFYKFANKILALSSEDYFNFTVEKADRWGRVNAHKVELLPYYMLVPEYRYFSGLEMLEDILGVSFKKDDIVRVENFSKFRVHEIPIDNRDFRIEINLCYGPSSADTRGDHVVLHKVEISFQSWKNKKWEHSSVERFIEEGMTGIKKLEEEIEALNLADGKSLSVLRKEDPDIVGKLLDFEDDWFVLANLFYTMYAGFYEDSVEYKFLKRYMERLKSFGDTFDEIFDVIDFISNLL
jgi:hypothetical protein